MRTFIDRCLEVALAALMALMTLDVLWQVFSRYILRSPSSLTDELARFLLIWIGVLGAAYVSGQDKHLAIDLLPNRLKGRSKQRLLIFIQAIILVFAFAVMVVGGIRLVYITLHLGQQASALQVPLGYVYTVVPLSGMVVVFYKALAIRNLFKTPNA